MYSLRKINYADRSRLLMAQCARGEQRFRGDESVERQGSTKSGYAPTWKSDYWLAFSLRNAHLAD